MQRLRKLGALPPHHYIPSLRSAKARGKYLLKIIYRRQFNWGCYNLLLVLSHSSPYASIFSSYPYSTFSPQTSSSSSSLSLLIIHRFHSTVMLSLLFFSFTQWSAQEFCSGGRGGAEDRENGHLGAVAPLVRGSGGSCNLVQEISFHIVKFS